MKTNNPLPVITITLLIIIILSTTGCTSTGDVITPPGIPYNITGINHNDTLIWNDTLNLFQPGTGGGGGTTYHAGTGLNLTGTTFSINNTIWGNNLTWDGTYVNATGGTGGGGNVGGLYGVNIQTLGLVDEKILYANVDEMYQFLTPLATNKVRLNKTGANVGDRFIIKNNAIYTSTKALRIYPSDDAAYTDDLYSGRFSEFIFNGTDWVCCSLETLDLNQDGNNIMLGAKAQGYDKGVAIGVESRGYSRGTGVGYQAWGNDNGVAIGYGAKGHSYGVGIGYYANTNSKWYSMALGYRSETERNGEFAINIGYESDQENNMMWVGFEGQTTSATPYTLRPGQYNSDCIIRPKSVITFDIKVTGMKNDYSDVAVYRFNGTAKQDASGNSVLVELTKHVTYEDNPLWDCNVTVDDTTDAIDITVTGAVGTTIQWVAKLDGVETHF